MKNRTSQGELATSHQTALNKLSLAVAMAIGCAAMPGHVLAQENDAANTEGGLEKIQVTARRTVESIQEVPVAITSVSAEDIAQRGMFEITEIQAMSPNTTLQRSRGTNSTLTAFIRGVGQQDPLWGYEPGVGIYIDDVYLARPQGAVLDILNVERIEVLRGPQGTLYGKNTIGGAVKYVTKEMSGDNEFAVQGAVGSYNQRDIRITGQVAITEELYLGYGYADLNRDGFGEYLESALPNQDLENYNKDLTAARLTLEYRPSDDLFFRINWDKTDDDSNAKGGYRLLPSILTDAPVPDSVFDSYTSLPTENKVELEGISLTAQWDISDNTSLKYIFSDRESYSPTNIDFDNTPLRIFDVPAVYDDEQTTHELQLAYDQQGLSLISGVYHYDGESCGQFDAILDEFGMTEIGTPGLTREISGCSNSNSIALYAQSSFDLTDKWSMTLGARYTREEREASVNNGLVFDTAYPTSGWVPGYVRDDAVIGQTVINVLDDEADWSRFTPRVGIEYQQSDDVMFYASYGQGFKSGTFNPRASGPEAAANPEIVDSFEVGMKSDWGDNLRVNLTWFTLDHKDRQYVVVLPGENSADLNQRLDNAGQSEADGIEAEVIYLATDDLSFNLSLGWIDAEFTEVLDTNPVTGEVFNNAAQYEISNTPELTYNLGMNYEFSNTLGDFVFNANYYFRDDYAINEFQNLLTQESYGLLNTSINWFSEDGHWTIGLHGKNLTDEEYMVGGYQFVAPDESAPGGFAPGLGGDNTLIAYYGDPRTVSLTVDYRF